MSGARRRTGHDAPQAGLLIGASIHKVGQAIGGGYVFADVAGGNATIVKLARASLLAPLVALVSLVMGRGDGERSGAWRRRLTHPWFIVALVTALTFTSPVTLTSLWPTTLLFSSNVMLLIAVTTTAEWLL